MPVSLIVTISIPYYYFFVCSATKVSAVVLGKGCASSGLVKKSSLVLKCSGIFFVPLCVRSNDLEKLLSTHYSIQFMAFVFMQDWDMHPFTSFRQKKI